MFSATKPIWPAATLSTSGMIVHSSSSTFTVVVAVEMSPTGSHFAAALPDPEALADAEALHDSGQLEDPDADPDPDPCWVSDPDAEPDSDPCSVSDPDAAPDPDAEPDPEAEPDGQPSVRTSAPSSPPQAASTAPARATPAKTRTNLLMTSLSFVIMLRPRQVHGWVRRAQTGCRVRAQCGLRTTRA